MEINRGRVCSGELSKHDSGVDDPNEWRCGPLDILKWTENLPASVWARTFVSHFLAYGLFGPRYLKEIF